MNFIQPYVSNYFDPHWLSPRFAHYVNQIHMKTGAPIPMVVAILLVTFSESGQGAYDVKMPDRRLMPLGMFGLIIASSGEGKSAVIDLARQEIVKLEQELAEKYKADNKQYGLLFKIWKTYDEELSKEFRRAIRKDINTDQIEQQIAAHQEEKPAKPRLVKLTYSKFTPEGLLAGMAEHWPHIGMPLDEASGFFNGRGVYDLPLYNDGWNGATLYKDSADHQASVTVYSPRMAGIFALQPSEFDRYLARCPDQGRGIGFFARCITCRPTSNQGYRNMQQANHFTADLGEMDQRIRELILESIAEDGQPAERKQLYFSIEAANHLADVGQTIELMMGSGCHLSNATDHGSKLIRNICRIAAALHLCEEKGLEISLGITRSAVDIAAYFSNEFLVMFDAHVKPPQAHKDAEALLVWLQDFAVKNGNRYIMRSDVMKLVTPSHLRKIEALNPAVNYLQQRGSIGLWQQNELHYIDTSILLPSDSFALQLAINKHRLGRRKRGGSAIST